MRSYPIFIVIIIFTLGFILLQNSSFNLLALLSSDTRVPFAPYNLRTSIANYNQITLSWVDDSSNTASLIPVIHFSVSRRQSNASLWINLGQFNGSSYVDTNMEPGSYDYRVNTCNDNGCSEYSSFITTFFAKDTEVPTKPQKFVILQKDVTNSTAKLSWELSTDNIGVSHYNIYRSMTSAEHFKVIASVSATGFSDTKLAPIANYYYQIRAVDYARNESPGSEIVSIVTLPLATTNEYVRIVSPNNGECFTLPGNLHVVWTGNNLNHSKLYFGNKLIFVGDNTTFDWYMTASVSPTTAGSVKIVAYNNNWEAGLSDINDGPFTIALNCPRVAPAPTSIPATPTLFRAQLIPEKRNIALSWQDNSENETEFRVFRRLLPDGMWGLLSKIAPNITNYIDTEVSPADYEYDVNACNNSGCSAYSNIFRITAIATLPTPTPAKIFNKSEIVQGDMVSASVSGDPDIFIVNEHGYKRLFLNPVIFGFYGHLGGFQNVKTIVSVTRDEYKTSGLFKNCETNDGKVYGVEITGEDSAALHWINTTGDKAVSDDPDFFKKVFCINTIEFNWYQKGADYDSVGQVPSYNQ